MRFGTFVIDADLLSEIEKILGSQFTHAQLMSHLEAVGVPDYLVVQGQSKPVRSTAARSLIAKWVTAGKITCTSPNCWTPLVSVGDVVNLRSADSLMQLCDGYASSFFQPSAKKQRTSLALALQAQQDVISSLALRLARLGDKVTVNFVNGSVSTSTHRMSDDQ